MSWEMLKIMSENEIKDLSIDARDLWMLNLNSETTGPHHTMELKSFFSKNKDAMDLAQVKKMDQDTWTDPSDHADFIIKKPTLQSLETLVNTQKFHLLFNGQIKGPFKDDEIFTKLQNQELNIFDIISDDEGMSWKKVYQFEAFDKFLSKKTLPGSQNISFDTDKDENNKSLSVLASQSLHGLIAAVQMGNPESKLKISEVQLPIEIQKKTKATFQFAMCIGVFSIFMMGIFFLSLSGKPDQLEASMDSNDLESVEEEVKQPTKKKRSPASFAPRNVVDKTTPNPSSFNRPQREPAYQAPIQEVRETHEEVVHQEPQDEPREEPVVEEGQEPNISRSAASDNAEDAPAPVEEVGDF